VRALDRLFEILDTFAETGAELRSLLAPKIRKTMNKMISSSGNPSVPMNSG